LLQCGQSFKIIMVISFMLKAPFIDYALYCSAWRFLFTDHLHLYHKQNEGKSKELFKDCSKPCEN
ncbi:MAG: hypothetical protein Q4C63_06100, partial [Eubacteriales bacterium]|nr:hypothetical protein [Eubacteriales bacterium]